MLPANRSPPMCVDSHVCSGNACESADASGRPRSAQHGSRRPCVQTANSGVIDRRQPDRSDRDRARRGRAPPRHGRRPGPPVPSTAGRGRCGSRSTRARRPRARPWRRISRTLIRSSRSRRRSTSPRPSGRRAWCSASLTPRARDAPRRSQLVMVDAVPRSGSSSASLAWEQRNDGSVTAAGQLSAVESERCRRGGVPRAPDGGRGRVATCGSASAGARSRTVELSDDATDPHRGLQPPGHLQPAIAQEHDQSILVAFEARRRSPAVA